ncbi:hypothetical protein BY996DRAFT_6567754 [Phakopsora pachyrhizi]|nr:hypothetical protein BY996DRAFT_6567754 [Phakopsora pachyrhizi]
MPGKKDRREKGRNRLSGRRRQSRKGDVDIAGPTAADNVRGRAISQGRQRKGLYGPTKARMRFGGLKVCLTDKEAMGREEAGGRLEEVSVGLVRRRETPRRTDIGGISRTVVGRALGVGPVGLRQRAVKVGRRARRRHTEVRSSYHFRVRTKVNSTAPALKLQKVF